MLIDHAWATPCAGSWDADNVHAFSCQSGAWLGKPSFLGNDKVPESAPIVMSSTGSRFACRLSLTHWLSHQQSDLLRLLGLQDKLEKLKEQCRALQEQADAAEQELSQRPSSAAYQRAVDAAASLQVLVGQQMDAEGWGKPADFHPDQLNTLRMLQVIINDDAMFHHHAGRHVATCPDAAPLGVLL